MPTRSARYELDGLCASWRAALNTAGIALDAAEVMLPSEGFHVRASRLRDERAAASRALESLAHNRHVDGWHADLRPLP